MKVVLANGPTVFAFEAPARGAPTLSYFGPGSAFDDRPRARPDALPASPDIRETDLLFPVEGGAFFGEPAILATRGRGLLIDLCRAETEQDGSSAKLRYHDRLETVEITLYFELHASGVLAARASIRNRLAEPLSIHRLAALVLPLPRAMSVADLTYGLWSGEGRSVGVPLVAGKIERTARSGRPGFDGGPHLIFKEPRASEADGIAIGLALAWSGDYSLFAEALADGTLQAAVAERLAPSEIVLGENELYETPEAFAAISDAGVGGLSAQFHAFARERAPASRVHRPVQLNSWEAAYFGVDEKVAMRLASEAAAIGAERFVLDDGWFRGRNSDRSGLGDWTPDPAKYPRGLAPLADHVRSLGLEFGLWVEPEMVNEVSDLFRKHPEWILSADGSPGLTARNQLVLDLTRADVCEYLYASIDGLLRSLPIGYLKWDCNRDLFPAWAVNGPATHLQIEGLYSLLDRLRAAHPQVSIESCASGGGRIDLGVLKRADRFWTSDSTDPIERVRIQRRASLFYPPELLGAHVGPSPNHWTGRATPMAFRCLTALFGHFGVELDPATLSPADRATLAAGVACYKKFRAMIVEGALHRFDNGEAGLDVQAIFAKGGGKALLRVLRTTEPDRLSLAPVRLRGLPRDINWRVTELAIDGSPMDAPLGDFSSSNLAFAGAALSPRHSATGRLFLMEALNG